MLDRAIEILLVEDNPGDARLTREILGEANVKNRLQHVPDGEAALAYLRREGPYATARKPHLILLDLKLPRKDGHEVLAEIKADAVFRHIPVIVLTSSERDEDIRKAYDLHANCYVAKPMDLNQFSRIVRVIEEFWLKIAKLPME